MYRSRWVLVMGLAIAALGGSARAPEAPPAGGLAVIAQDPRAHRPAPVRLRLAPADRVYSVTGAAGVTLSFDDGPDPLWTPQVLAVLRQHHVHAVFCMIGFRARAHPELVREVIAGGHALCNHTADHDPALGLRAVPEMERNLRTTDDVMTAAGGVRPRYFRAAHGNFTPALVGVARRLGLASLGWQVTASDWQSPEVMTPEAIAAQVTRTVRPGCIVLFHDGGSPGTHWQTVDALELVLADLDRRGRRVTDP
jgi:peptidoglycan/xylan/chitin deacetylase (PgdA/CDA1 family)